MITLSGAAMAALLCWCLVILGKTELDRIRYRRLIRSHDLDQFRIAARRFPKGQRRIAMDLAEQLESGRPLDGALLNAMQGAVACRLGPNTFGATLRETLVVGVGCAPWVPVLLIQPIELLDELQGLRSATPALILLTGPDVLQGPIEQLANAYVEAGWMLCAVVLFWMLHGWLRGPAVLEARFLRALLKAGIQLAPDAPAPVAGRLAKALGPQPGLGRPVLAALAWVLALALSWSAMYASSDLRRSRGTRSSFSAWSGHPEPALEVPEKLNLPVVRGGAPVTAGGLPIRIGPETVWVGDVLLSELKDLRLPRRWEAAAARRLNEAETALPTERPVWVVVDKDVALETVLDVLRLVSRGEKLEQLELLFRRPGTNENHLAQLPARLTSPPTDTLRVVPDEEGRFQVSGRAGEDASSNLRTAVQAAVRRGGEAPTIEVEGNPGTPTWGRLLTTLGAADSTCPTAQPCALPGFGLSVIFGRDES